MNEIDRLSYQLTEAIAANKSARFAMQKHMHELQQYRTRLRYVPDDAKATKKLASLEKQTNKIKATFDEGIQNIRDLKCLIETERGRTYRLSMKEAARSIELNIPDDDPMLGLTMISGMASSLQYWFVNGISYYEHLITKVYTRFDDSGEDKGHSYDDKTNPEIDSDDDQRLEDLRNQREHCLVLRLAVEQAYNEMLKKLPDNAPYIPKLLYRTDEQLQEQVQARRGSQFIKQRSQATEAASKAKALARSLEQACEPEVPQEEKHDAIQV